MIKPQDLREAVIEPVLEALGGFNPKLNSEAAVDLLMGTASAESALGYNLVQDNHGPAMGIFQMEEATHADIYRYLDRHPDLFNIIDSMTIEHDAEEMIYNLRYAAAMARIRYWYVPEPMPNTREQQAVYWKKFYNTPLGAGTPEKYLARYEKYIGD